jgi:hypothetical protein
MGRLESNQGRMDYEALEHLGDAAAGFTAAITRYVNAVNVGAGLFPPAATIHLDSRDHASRTGEPQGLAAHSRRPGVAGTARRSIEAGRRAG